MIEYIHQFMGAYDLATELRTLFWLLVVIGTGAAVYAMIHPEEW